MLMEMLYHFRDIVIGPNLDERRSTPRARCNIPLSCQTADGALVCTLRDLSSSGARLLTDQKCRRGAIIKLSPPKGMDEGAKNVVKAKIAWVRPIRGAYMMGVKFDSAGGGWVRTVLREIGLSPGAPTQQRKFVRVPGDINVRLQAQGFEKTVRLRDLGIGGALLSGRDHVSKDQSARLTLPAEMDVPELQLPCIACGCKKSGDSFDISVKFVEVPSKQRKVLVKHLSLLMRRSLGAG